MNEKRVKDALETIALSNVPNDTDLWSRIAFQLDERKSLMRTLRARPVLLVMVLLLLFSLLGSVAYAVGRSLGYVPGVGLMEEGSGIRVLAEPVSLDRDGLIVTVEKVVADMTHTIIAYRIDGIPTVSSGFPTCAKTPLLRLQNGSELSSLGGGEGGMESINGQPMSFQTSYTFPPLPADTKKLNIVFPCILPEPESGSEEWSIPLVLVPAPADYVTPAIEIGATYVSSGPSFETTPTPTFENLTPFVYDPSFPPTPTQVPNGSGLYLDRVIELADSYILIGNFTDAGDLPGALQISGASMLVYRPHIEDLTGKPVHFYTRADIQPDVNWMGSYFWAYEIPKPVQGPITIILDKINIHTSSTIRFDFDTGPDPQPGQTWQLDLPIHLGRYDYVMDSVEMIENGYNFRFHSGVDVPEGTSFILDILGGSQERGPGSGVEDRRPKKLVKYSQSITYLDSPPTGTLIVELTLFESIPLQGPWKLTWTPPNK